MANMFSTFFSGNRFAKFFQKGRTDQEGWSEVQPRYSSV